jgi:hypothetical protein
MELSLVSNILAAKNIFNKAEFPLAPPAAGKVSYLLPPDNFLFSIKNSKGIVPISFAGEPESNLKFTPEATGYYPDSSKLEGGFHDKMGKKLCTLQDYLEGKAPYVSIALDKNLYKSGVIRYGDKFRIPELEAKYHRVIEFRAVDTGGAFTNKKFSRVDICNRSRKDAWDSSVNTNLTLIKV